MCSLSVSWQRILTEELSLRTTRKCSCHFLFNHLGMPTLQNSTQFSNLPISLSDLTLATDCRYMDSARTTQKTPFTHVAYCCTCYPATSCLPRICLRGNLFIEPLPSSASHGRDENNVENFNPKT
jgi:hypothetical protein